jgi:hypothetical protein
MPPVLPAPPLAVMPPVLDPPAAAASARGELSPVLFPHPDPTIVPSNAKPANLANQAVRRNTDDFGRWCLIRALLRHGTSIAFGFELLLRRAMRCVVTARSRPDKSGKYQAARPPESATLVSRS